MNSSLIQVAFTAVRHFSRELNIGREAFIGQLPSSIPHRMFTLHGDLIRISEKSGSVWIGMTTLVEAHRGEMRLPVIRLDFAFEGLSDSEIDDFMSRSNVVAKQTGPKLPLDGTGVCLGTGGVPGRSRLPLRAPNSRVEHECDSLTTRRVVSVVARPNPT
jgi:hypothetical protein